jgi:UDP-N-acetylmuramyl pentapeptide synthase
VYGDETELIQDEFLRRGGVADRLVKVESLNAIREELSGFGEGDTILVKGSRALELERAFE